MSEPKTPDIWAIGNAYEPYVGRWSRLVAATFLDWLAIPPDRRWLDVGCGTGMVTQTILQRANPHRVVGIDPSEGFITYARHRAHDGRAMFRTGDAMDLHLESASFDCVVSGLALNFMADQDRALSEMRRVGRPGATVALYVWDYSGDMQMMRYFWDAAIALNPGARDLDEGTRFRDCQPDPLRKMFARAGLQSIAVEPIVVPTVFKDFNDYWTPFLGGQGPAPGYCISLAEKDRNVLRERLRKSLPTAPDGSIPLKARAWAIKGTK